MCVALITTKAKSSWIFISLVHLSDLVQAPLFLLTGLTVPVNTHFALSLAICIRLPTSQKTVEMFLFFSPLFQTLPALTPGAAGRCHPVALPTGRGDASCAWLVLAVRCLWGNCSFHQSVLKASVRTGTDFVQNRKNVTINISA